LLGILLEFYTDLLSKEKALTCTPSIPPESRIFPIAMMDLQVYFSTTETSAAASPPERSDRCSSSNGFAFTKERLMLMSKAASDSGFIYLLFLVIVLY
jgi:hypothetical protein